MHLFFALLLSCVLVPDESVLVTTTGEQVTGSLQAVTQDSVEFSGADGVQTYPFEQVASISLEFPLAAASELGPIEIVLVDQSLIRATSVVASANKLTVRSDDLMMEFENRNVSSVLLNRKSTPEFETQWKKIQTTELESGDAVVVQRNSVLETVEGIVGEITSDKLEFSMNDRSAQIDRSKIVGFIFYHADGREIPSPVCQLALQNGSTIQARQIAFAGATFDVTAASGAQFELPGDSVSRLDFASGREVILSSMEPTNRDWIPLIAGSAIMEKLRQVKLPRTNRSFDNRPLELTIYPDDDGTGSSPRTERFDNGFAMFGGSKLVFSLDNQFERLTGRVGFSPRANSSGNVSFQIRCDGQVVFNQHIRKSDNLNPINLDVNVKDVERLVIEVDYHDGRAIGDIIHLCNLKVSR